TVLFELFGPADPTCAGPPVFTSTSALAADVAGSGPVTTTVAGTYHWFATYNGDTFNAPVRAGCQDEPVTVDRVTPMIQTDPSSAGPAGSPISDTAIVSGGFSPAAGAGLRLAGAVALAIDPPTGTVTFRLYPPADTTCTGTPVFTSTNPLDAAGL